MADFSDGQRFLVGQVEVLHELPELLANNVCVAHRVEFAVLTID